MPINPMHMNRIPPVPAARAILAATVGAAYPSPLVPIADRATEPEVETAEPFSGSALSRT